MATTINPPDGWTMVTGTWGTDAVRSTSVTNSSGGSLNLVNTAVATQMLGPWMGLDCANTARYTANAVVQVDHYSGDTLNIFFDQYAADRTTLIASTQLLDSAKVVVGSWVLMSAAFINAPGGSRAYWGRFRISKSATVFNAYIDRVEIRQLAPHLEAYQFSSAQAIPASTPGPTAWTNIKFDGGYIDTTWTKSGVSYDGTTGLVTVYEEGVYLVIAQVQFSGLPNNTEVDMRIAANGTGYFTSQQFLPSTLQTVRLVALVDSGYIFGGGLLNAQFSVQVAQYDTVARNIVGGTLSTSPTFLQIKALR